MGIKIYFKRTFSYIFRGIPRITVTVNISRTEQNELFRGKKCIITGGSGGIGYEIARKIIECGGLVLITGRDKERLISASERLGVNCKILVFDATRTRDVGDFIDKAKKHLGGEIDQLVCNAGISMHEQDILHVSVDDYREQFATNLDGYYFLAQEFIRKADRQTDHSILMISSERGLQCDDVPYGLTKAAVNSLIRGLSRRYYTSGFRVNGIAPGITISDMNPQKINRDNLYTDQISSKRYFLPEEVAEVAAFLLSDAAKCISGEIIACDAGNYLDSYIRQ